MAISVQRGLRRPEGRVRKLETARGARLGYLLIAPLLIWLIGTVAYPVGYAVYYSMTDTGFLGTQANFVGLQNYGKVMRSSLFWDAVGRSFLWTFGNAVLQVILAFFAALVLNQRIRGQGAARVWIILPWIIPTIVLAIIWRWMLSPSIGVVNYVLVALGILAEPVNFLGSPSLALPTLVVINSWRWFPFLAIIILAALHTIPDELYEAASLDGATGFQRFFRITLPFLRPTMGVLGLIGTLWSVNVFDVIWLLTRGGPSNATMTLPVYIYDRAFQGFAMSEAAAASVLLLGGLVLFASLYLWLEKSIRDEHSWW